MNLGNTCYIVGAASLDGVRLSPRAGDYVIAADGGYRSLKARGIALPESIYTYEQLKAALLELKGVDIC